MHTDTDTAALPESVLVEWAQDGDDRAFEALVRRHQDVVYRIALRTLGNAAEARDTAQEALITAWRKLPGLRDPHTFPAWLHRIVGRLALNALRARRPEEPAEEDAEFRERGAGPADRALATDLNEALREALSGLPPPQRICWVLREMEGLGYEEIAEIVDTTPTAVRGRIHRARTHLVEALEPWR
ncbi:sigma-70 family RNA polymerase sigma factor [Nocardiopsis exhalans]|uniref:RNA polymerase sigma-70 factor (ECF subfamily) n=2 Tax=Nocardiopsis TaxID=2013 RepID=A0A840WE99_9ACTN|nr:MULTISPECIES: sigma-70 family RNA polymerase sigma factor [Nocardiopsis]MBB5493743.1 RNA polymerase sigma-70 factor (ECF subfamily) [Nocardiopsis metallicus]USY20367.1 sigma-70 family RNA polymerase sigma factor [Nocardiopsis exhalans]